MRTRFLALCLFFLVAVPAGASSSTHGFSGGPRPLLSDFYWLPDPDGRLSLADVLEADRAGRFERLGPSIPVRAGGPAWLRLELPGADAAARSAAGRSRVLRLGRLPSGETHLYYPAGSTAEGAPLYDRLALLSHESVRLPEPGLSPLSVYIRMDDAPGLWFRPVMGPVESMPAPFLPGELLLPGLLLAGLALCLLRGVQSRRVWPLWAGLFLVCVLVQDLLPVPPAMNGFRLEDLPALLAPGLSLMLLAQCGRLVLHSRATARTLDSALLVYMAAGATLCLAPLVPGLHWLVRLFPLWPLLLAGLVPAGFAAVAARKPGGLAFLGACLMPALGAAISLYAAYADSVPLAETAPLWGLALGGVSLALARSGSGSAADEEDVFADAPDAASDRDVSVSSREGVRDQASELALADGPDFFSSPSAGFVSRYSNDPLPYPEPGLAGSAASFAPSRPSPPIPQTTADPEHFSATDDFGWNGGEAAVAVAPDTEPHPGSDMPIFGFPPEAFERDQPAAPAGAMEEYSVSAPAGAADFSDAPETQGAQMPATDAADRFPEGSAETVEGGKAVVPAAGQAASPQPAPVTDVPPVPVVSPVPPLASVRAVPQVSPVPEDEDYLRQTFPELTPDRWRRQETAAETGVAPTAGLPEDDVLPLREDQVADADRGPVFSATPRVISLVDDDLSEYSLADLDDEERASLRSVSLSNGGKFIFSLHDLVRDIHGLAFPLARSKGILFSWFVSPSLPDLLEGDAPSLRQTLSLLIQNAVQATRQGSVRLSVRRNEVPGATDGAECCDLLFTLVDSGSAQRTDAGFFHAWELASRTGGGFQVTYSPSGGTAVAFSACFSLPGEDAAAAFYAAGASSGQAGPEGAAALSFEAGVSARGRLGNIDRILEEEGFRVPGAAEAAPCSIAESGRASGSAARAPAALEDQSGPDRESGLLPGIIVADMTTSHRRLLANYLAHLPHDHLEARSMREALELLERPTVRLLIVDGDMPEVEILEALAAIRAQGGWGDLPVLGLIGHESQAERLRGAGCSLCLAKPFSREDLEAAVLRLVPDLEPTEASGADPAGPAADRVSTASDQEEHGSVQRSADRVERAPRLGTESALPGASATPPASAAKAGTRSGSATASSGADGARLSGTPRREARVEEKGEADKSSVAPHADPGPADGNEDIPTALTASGAAVADAGQGAVSGEGVPLLDLIITEELSADAEEPGDRIQAVWPWDGSSAPGSGDTLAFSSELAVDAEARTCIRVDPEDTPGVWPLAASAQPDRDGKTTAPVSAAPGASQENRTFTQEEESADADALPMQAEADAETASPTFPLPGLDESVSMDVMPLLPGLVYSLEAASADCLQGCADQQCLLVQEAASRIAGNAELFGLYKLGKIARCVERAAEADDLDAVTTLMDDLVAVAKRYAAALKECHASFLNLDR